MSLSQSSRFSTSISSRPWWEEDEKRVQVVGEEDAEKSSMPECEKGVKGLPDSFSPSPLVRYGLANILYAYCHGVRIFRGDQ